MKKYEVLTDESIEKIEKVCNLFEELINGYYLPDTTTNKSIAEVRELLTEIKS